MFCLIRAVRQLPPSSVSVATKKAAAKQQPEQGREETEEEEEEDLNDPFSIKATAEQLIAARILDRVRHFVPCRIVEAQLDSLACIASCLKVRFFFSLVEHLSRQL